MITVADQKRMLNDAMSRQSRLAGELLDWKRRGELSREDLRKLIARRPEVYGFMRGYLDNDANWETWERRFD